MSIAEILSNRLSLPTVSSSTFRLKLQPPQKHVDKSQKQQFIVEFPVEASSLLGNVAAVNIDRRHFLPPVLLTGIAKQQKEEKGKNGSPVTAQGELSIQILSREDKEITFDKCERCQEKDSHIFPLFEKNDSHEERERQHPRNCFALIGCDKAQFDKGKAIIPIYFRCCPTHHTSKKGENFVKMKVAITKGTTVFESEFVKVQWKKGKHSRTTATPTKPVSTSSPLTSNNSSPNTTPFPEANPAPLTNTPLTNTSNPTPAPVQPAPLSRPISSSSFSVNNNSTAQPPATNHVQLPSLFNPSTPPVQNNSTTTTSPWNMPNNPFSTINPGVPPYQAYMNMFQHLQNYYVQPLEEENKKLRKELTDSTRSVAGLKEENRTLRETMMVHRPDEHFLDQLKSYQYEISCAPSFLAFEEDEESYDDEMVDEKELNSLPQRGVRQAMKFMKFRANIKLVLLKHNGTHWFEPIDRVSSPHYTDGERIGIRIINKNRFPVMVRLHKINHANSCISIPLSSDDFLRIDGCREEEGSWETAYFDLGQCKLPKEQPEAVELLKLLVTTALSAQHPDRLSTIAVKSFTIQTPSQAVAVTTSS